MLENSKEMTTVNKYEGVANTDIIVNDVDIDEGCISDLGEEVSLIFFKINTQCCSFCSVSGRHVEVTYFFR